MLESRYAQTRVRRGPGIRDRVQTGNIIAATFRHETSCEQDPQLHTHCVIINATQLANGRWQSMANEEVLNNQKLLGEIYQNELAVQLRQLGYEIEPQGNGLFECKDYAEPLLDLFSTRTQQIEQYIERFAAALKESGGKPLHAKQKKQATLATRLRKKTVPREVLLDGWHRAIASSDIHLPALPEKAPEPIATQATLSATAGVSHAAERESVFKREKAERFALEHHLGEQSFAELQSAMSGAGLIAAKNRFTTTGAIARELDTIAIMESGQEQADAISDDLQINQMLMREQTLTDGQRQAIQTTAQSRDQVMAWQGVAGAGKTYSLKLLAQLAIDQSYAVISRGVRADAAESYRAATDASGELAAVASRRQQQLAQEGKCRRRRQIYQQYAAKFVGKSMYECDHLVAHQLMSELLAARRGRTLSKKELQQVGGVLLQGPVAQQLKQTQGKEAGVEYAAEVLVKERKEVERVQRHGQDQGMER